ncbi:protein neprosin-like isoform X2 [Primulina tabacum]|uniref:protein neprosin-like isoform X2 n=1 Tax=Primulina tabacum TaxID=48773 RepID=UPI003F593BDE
MGRVSVVRQGRFSCPIYSGNSILQSCSLFLVFLSFFLVLFSKKTMAVSTSLNYTKYKQVSSLRLARIQRHLDKINKPPVFTIQSPDGDIIDCIHKRKQPALDHPLLQKHKIQRVAPEMPKVMKTVKNSSNSFDERLMGGAGWQMWHQNGQRCPKGTIPVRRSTSHDVLRAKSLYDFGKKQKTAGMAQFASRLSSVDAPDVVNAYTTASDEVYGARATINVWDPSIETVNEFSLSQIWVLSGSFDGSDLNSIEAGWQVSPELYGDNRPRLFTYWTSDAYQATGCYNLLCSGFVQTNSRIAIGAAISPVSSMGGNQYDITILIWKDPKLGNWWMRFGDNTLVGYWPNELFTHLADRATMVEWGGEIVNSGTNDEHTTTQMGSGQFAQDGFGKASYFRNLEIVDSDNSLTTAQDISVLAENSNCYNILSSHNSEWGTHFYYGGPGRNPNCQ